jgi:hypothetical protein
MEKRDSTIQDIISGLQYPGEYRAKVPPILRAADLLGVRDVHLARGISAMGGQKISQAQINHWRSGRAPIPKKHIPKLVAYISFGVEHLSRLAQEANEPAWSSVWAAYQEVEKILADVLTDPEVKEKTFFFQQKLDQIFEGTPAGRAFLREQSKKALGWRGRKQ